MDQSDTTRVTLKAAMTTVPLDSHKYLVHIPLDHCYGKTVHGGLLVSVVIFAAQQHFGSTLRSYNHPDTFNIETVFLRPAIAGKAVVTIRDVQLGKKISTIHFTLTQNQREIIVGYASNTNLNSEKGISYPIPNILTPEPAPVDLEKLADGLDPHWVGYTIPWHPDSFFKPITHFKFFSPIHALPQKNVTDVWMKFISAEEKFTNEMLGSVADHWHRMVENYCPKSAWNNVQLPMNALRAATEGSQFQGNATSYWYPTLSMHLEIKKSLPSRGVQWLFLRARSTEIKNGRFDAEITILDEKLELVALSHQVCFVVDVSQIVTEKRLHKDGKL